MERNIDTLGGLKGIRKTRAMYIGSTNIEQDGYAPPGLTQLAQEVISNSLDEYLTGYGDVINVTIDKDQTMTVQDFGRGLPKGNGKNNFDKVIRSVTVPHSSGKFSGSQYETGAAGMHGIGIKAVAAVSDFVHVHAIEQHSDGGLLEYQIHFEFEDVVHKEVINTWKKSELEQIDNSTFKVKKTDDIIKSGTTIKFRPDNGVVSETEGQPVFGSIVWTLNALKPRLEASAILNSGLKIVLQDNRTDETITWQYDNGLLDYMDKISEHETALSGLKDPIVIQSEKDVGDLGNTNGGNYYFKLDAVIKFVDDIDTLVLSYANGVPTRLGGTHHNGFINGLTKSIIDYGTDKKLFKGKVDVKDIEQGLMAVFAVKVPSPIVQFDGQTKDRLSTAQARPVTQEIVYNSMIDWLYDNEKQSKIIVDKINESKAVREAMLKARKNTKEAKNSKQKGKLVLSSKLKTASSRNPKEKEMFITEGDSASNIKRDTRTQAIFPIRGKIKNAYELSLSTALKNDEISTISSVIGAGIGGAFEIDEMQYDKVIIATDADPDGSHIRILLIGLFYRFFKPMIEQGKLYFIEPPLYKATKYIKGKPNIKMYYNDSEIEKDRKNLKGYEIQRYKGLGEMDTDEAFDAITRHDTRKLVRISLDDAEQASNILKIMLGKNKKDSERRAEWITENIDFEEIYEQNGGL